MRAILFSLLVVQLLLLINQIHSSDQRKLIITAITDSGCAKPTQIEIKQKQSNADVYNYAALSTNY